jgi:hypothetical protein
VVLSSIDHRPRASAPLKEDAGLGRAQTATGARSDPRPQSWASRALKGVATYALIILATTVVIDTVLFFGLPYDMAAEFPGYREGTFMIGILGRGYPKDYFEANAERGFDIRPTAVPRTDQYHNVGDYTYRIWSNEVGCFDRPVAQLKDRFWYLAGDSFVWGYAKYEDTLGSVLERLKGVDILKCGVTHTGTRHQFAKFLEVSKKLGRFPEKVIVAYSPNDTANDYLYPHSTVVDGQLADMKMIDHDNNIIVLDQGWFDKVKRDRRRARPTAEGQPTNFSLSRLLMTYSLSAQLLNAGLYYIDNHAPGIGRWIGVLGDEPGLDWYDKYFRYKGKKMYDLHRLCYLETRGGYLRYTRSKYAEPNKAAIRQWRDHAAANGYKLEFVLLHPGSSGAYDGEDVTNFYKEVVVYLSALGIRYYDLPVELKKRGIETDDLYWEDDSHMSPTGDRMVGKILSELM